MTPQQAINQLKRNGFSDEEIVEAVFSVTGLEPALPKIKQRYLVIDNMLSTTDKNDGILSTLTKGTWVLIEGKKEERPDIDYGRAPTFDTPTRMETFVDLKFQKISKPTGKEKLIERQD